MRAPDFWRRDGFLPRLLAPLGSLYDQAGRRRRARTVPANAQIPVVCIGNLVAGGAGKTPVALALAELLTMRGLIPFFLTRGYGGRLSGPLLVEPEAHGFVDVGDEALLLAAGVPTILSRDRIAGAHFAARSGAELILMDDGFQNPSLAKDCSLLVVDGAYGFGNGRIMPAGPLRETIEAGLARADGIVLLGDDRHGLVPALSDRLPVFRAHLTPRGEASRWNARRVVAFAGIGRPEKFFATLAELGAVLVETIGFADHHPYRPDQVRRLVDRARMANARLVTTEKDWVRLPADLRDGIDVLPVTLAWSGANDETGIVDLLLRAAGRNS